MDFVDKYRPRELKDLIGQEAAIAKVEGMIRNKRIAQKILITGDSGVGKTSLMLILAHLFNGVKYGKPLPDMTEYNIGSQRGIDDIREISATANYAPHRRYRVIILDEVHRVGAAAAPAILKPLENTPKKTIWLLATSEPHTLLPTIIRRCYLLPLVHPTPRQVFPLLEKVCQREGIKFPEQERLLKALAQVAQGQPALSLQLLQGAADANTGDNYKKILQSAFAASPALVSSQLAVKCLVYIYLKQPKQLLASVKQVGSNIIPFVNALLNMNNWLIDRQLGQGTWRSPLTNRLLQYTQDVELDRLISTHNNLVDLRGEVQRFLFPELHLLTARLIKLALGTKQRQQQ